MPFVRISIKKQLNALARKGIADAVHEALVSAVKIPTDDRFQIIETKGDDIIYDPAFLGITRDDGIIFIEIHLSPGRSTEIKQALYAEITRRLTGLDIKPDNVVIHLVETQRENWSFGQGVAQYVLNPPSHLPKPA
jgi:4-oxalocrotonate tautomerase